VYNKSSYANSDKKPKAALGLMFGFSEGNNVRKVKKIPDSKLCNYITKSLVSIH
jgi:hypothetical protein